MGLLKVNFAYGAGDEPEIYAVPTDLVKAIKPSPQDPENESVISFREDITNKNGYNVYVKKNFNSLCDIFKRATKDNATVNLTRITQDSSFSRGTPSL